MIHVIPVRTVLDAAMAKFRVSVTTFCKATMVSQELNVTVVANIVRAFVAAPKSFPMTRANPVVDV
jgi:hypothetical protein